VVSTPAEWHSAGSLGWPFPMLTYGSNFIKQNSKLPKCGLQFKKKNIIVSFIIIFGTLSPHTGSAARVPPTLKNLGTKRTWSRPTFATGYDFSLALWKAYKARLQTS